MTWSTTLLRALAWVAVEVQVLESQSVPHSLDTCKMTPNGTAEAVSVCCKLGFFSSYWRKPKYAYKKSFPSRSRILMKNWFVFFLKRHTDKPFSVNMNTPANTYNMHSTTTFISTTSASNKAFFLSFLKTALGLHSWIPQSLKSVYILFLSQLIIHFWRHNWEYLSKPTSISWPGKKMSSWDSEVIHCTKTSSIAISFLVSGSKKS